MIKLYKKCGEKKYLIEVNCLCGEPEIICTTLTKIYDDKAIEKNITESYCNICGTNFYIKESM